MKSRYINQYGLDSPPNLREASRIGCQIFVTINLDLIKDRKELEKKFKIKIRTPGEILEENKHKRENPHSYKP